MGDMLELVQACKCAIAWLWFHKERSYALTRGAVNSASVPIMANLWKIRHQGSKALLELAFSQRHM